MPGLARRKYRLHFALIAFAIVGSIQGLALLLQSKNYYLASTVTLFVAIVAMLFYYIVYASAYSSFLKLKNRKSYYHSLYNGWGVSVFSCLFLITIGQGLHWIHSDYLHLHLPRIVSGTPTLEEFIKFTVYKAVNTISIDYLEVFGPHQWKLTPDGDFGLWIVYLIGVFYQTIFVATFIKEITRFFTRYPFQLEIFEADPRRFHIEPNKITPGLIEAIRDQVNTTDYSYNFQENVSNALAAHDGPEIQDIYSRLLCDTDARSVFFRSLEFFVRIKRLDRARQRLRDLPRDRDQHSWLRDWENSSRNSVRPSQSRPGGRRGNDR